MNMNMIINEDIIRNLLDKLVTPKYSDIINRYHIKIDNDSTVMGKPLIRVNVDVDSMMVHEYNMLRQLENVENFIPITSEIETKVRQAIKYLSTSHALVQFRKG